MPPLTQIRKVVSIYRGIHVYDVALLRYVGVNTYATLRRLNPNLYQDFIECQQVYSFQFGINGEQEPPSQIEFDIIDSGLTPLQIKEQLLALITENSDVQIGTLVRSLHNSSPPPGKDMLLPPMATVWWIIILFVIIFSIVGALYVLGAIDAFIESRPEALYHFVAVPPTPFNSPR